MGATTATPGPIAACLRYGACLVLAALLPGLASGGQNVVYEFPSCVRDSGVVKVLTMPATYGDIGGDRRINNRFAPGEPGHVTFFRTYLFTTYPDFEPLASASEEAKARTKAALGAASIASAWVIYGNGIEFYLARDKSPPEETPDGKYWVYPDRIARAGRPSHDRMNNFLPKHTGRDVLIRCADQGENALPRGPQRCTVHALMTETPDLACVTVGFRIPAEDLADWASVERRLKQKVRSMLTERRR